MQERFFTIFKVTKTGQKESKTSKIDMILTGTPEAAARKAMTKLCETKTIHGRCALRVTVVELVPNKGYTAPKYVNGKVVYMMKADETMYMMKPKTYSYRLQYRKLKTPKIIVRNGKAVMYEYTPVITSYLNKK